MTEEVNLVAIIELKEGAWSQISQIVNECVIKSREEKGNCHYTACFQADRQNRIVFIECWANQQVLDKHCQTEHFQNLMRAVKPHVLQPLELLNLIPVTEKK